LLAVEVDGLGPLPARRVQTILDPVDGDHPAGAEQLGAQDRKLSDGSAAEHGYGVPFSDLGDVSAEIAGREDIRDQDGVLV
jgi:hypothetical protein